MRGLLLLGAMGVLLALSPVSLSATTADNQAYVYSASVRSDAPSANLTPPKKVDRAASAEASVAGVTQKVILLSAASLILAMGAVGARALWVKNIVRSPLYGGME
ncbi:MAG TPA: hypothetical protein VKS78_09460 [Roseiarcus sp.]|nr:hypothetical protein [Roseiarcus sp.]